MPRALILGGTGLIGRAAAKRLRAAGWTVDAPGRDVDRTDQEALAAAMGDGADLLVDCLCYSAADARLLLPLARRATSTVMISAKAVYVDSRGRHANSPEPPRFDGPVTEDQPTLEPEESDPFTREGYGPNKVAAERTLLDSGLPVTVLRPSKVHGPGNKRPLERYFVERILAGHRVVVLASRGEGVDHPTATANLAALIETAAHHPGARVLNAADPDAPNGLEISRIIAASLDWSWHEILLDHAEAGLHPWHRGFVLDTSAALALGYRPVGDYAFTVQESLRELV
ncbi:NAD-dependent epimerase/dehydratase family protein [Lentzea aerocolonigenes]|uniref:NAD-dependent epimerase/dehydratase family protein n=1 Tax=Lentzea aerocolonigenes TaxID=68170 RepID=UPI00056A08D4|nr:NAD-dependent epimerase/dehydratase family protein [Lentzea aerocolonigenes]MCP2242799.1 Nucleoside-diphosphate-sugar epimerase [Lentzea aerocolonigenes]